MNGSISVSEIDVCSISNVSIIAHSNDDKITLGWILTVDGGLLVIFPIWSETFALNFEENNDFFLIVIPGDGSCYVTWHLSLKGRCSISTVDTFAVHLHCSPVSDVRV